MPWAMLWRDRHVGKNQLKRNNKVTKHSADTRQTSHTTSSTWIRHANINNIARLCALRHTLVYHIWLFKIRFIARSINIVEHQPCCRVPAGSHVVVSSEPTRPHLEIVAWNNAVPVFTRQWGGLLHCNRVSTQAILTPHSMKTNINRYTIWFYRFPLSTLCVCKVCKYHVSYAADENVGSCAWKRCTITRQPINDSSRIFF